MTGPSPSSPVVAAQGLFKSFGELAAVAGISFTVSAGEVYGLLGGNGAGKTTTLRLLTGLLAPTAGSLRLAGVDVVADPTAAKQRFGFATASAGLYPRLTVREMLEFVGGSFGLDGEALARRVAVVASSVDLTALLDRRCEALSTGQKQRASLARAVLPDPPVLILDEPTAGLDVLASRFLRDLVLAERTRGKAIILSTHYLTEAELLCDRVGLLHRGRLLREGTPEALRAQAGVATLEEALIALVEAEEAAARAAQPS